MLRSYFQAALRHFRVNKFHTAINIAGLCLGIAASLLAGMFVVDEVSFDKFHPQLDRMYRLNKITTNPDGSKSPNSETSGMMGPAMLEEFPEVEEFTRLQPWFEEVVLSDGEKKIVCNPRDLVFADSNFFQVMGFKLLKGNPNRVLSRPSTMVLTATSAASLFGDSDPVGKTIKGIEGLDFEITGVVEDPPRQSHIQFAGLMSWGTTEPGRLNYDWMNNWIAQGINTYIVLRPGADYHDVDKKFPEFMKTHMPTRMDRYALYLQPFRDIYLRSFEVRGNHPGKLGNIQYIYVFAIIAAFMLFIACINYINISTSRSVKRAREVGMRKTMGASRNQLVTQFLGESFLTTTIATVLAIGLLYLAIPYFNQVAGKTMTWSLLFNPAIVAGTLLVILLVGLVSGFYPALVLSAYKPTQIFRAASSRGSGQWPRYVLITFQFTVSILLVGVMLVVNRQMEFVMSKELGFDKSHVMVVNLSTEAMKKSQVLKEWTDNLPGVESTSLARTALGNGGSSTFVIPEGFNAEEVEVRMFPVDCNFLRTYGMSMSKGHFFQQGSSRDSSGLVINEALLKRLGWADPLQKTIRFNPEDPAQPVIGVVDDFQFASLYEDVDPLVMWISKRPSAYLSVRFSGNPAPLIAKLDEKWKTLDGLYPFSYYFLDKRLALSYESDEKLYDTVVAFSVLSIFISCLGLYGLVSLILEQKTKEFGVRKVLGASAINLHWLVNRKFVSMILVAAVVAIPLVSGIAQQWIQKFAYQAEPGAGPYFWAVAITLMVMLVAVSIQMVRLATDNPVKALRQES